MTALDKLKKLCEAATPGPWEYNAGKVEIDTRKYICCGRGLGKCCLNPEIDGEYVHLFDVVEATDAEISLCITTKQALPALIRLVEAMDKRFEHLAQEHGMVARAHAKDVFDARRELEEVCSR